MEQPSFVRTDWRAINLGHDWDWNNPRKSYNYGGYLCTDFICKNCRTKLFEYELSESDNINYRVISSLRDLTCEEILLKNIIE